MNHYELKLNIPKIFVPEILRKELLRTLSIFKK